MSGVRAYFKVATAVQVQQQRQQHAEEARVESEQHCAVMATAAVRQQQQHEAAKLKRKQEGHGPGRPVKHPTRGLAAGHHRGFVGASCPAPLPPHTMHGSSVSERARPSPRRCCWGGISGAVKHLKLTRGNTY